MATQAEKMHAMMARMRADYVAALPGRLDTIEALAGRCLTSPPPAPPDALEELRRLVHSLKGSGATFGLPAVSERAAALETLVLAWQAAGAVGPPSGIERGVASLREAIPLPPAGPG